jgi:hypothetical protein
MKYCFALYLSTALCLSFSLSAQEESSGEKPEVLHYQVNWPSGLGLGEGMMQAKKLAAAADADAERWEFRLTLDAAIPAFEVKDRLRSVTNGDHCSVEFEKDSVHGKKRANEKLAFDQAAGRVTRETIGGGKSDLPASNCARDALAFLHFTRKELARGRIPAAQTVFFGAPYQVRMEYGGVHNISTGGTTGPADRLITYVKGPASEFTVELFFSRDAARTPVLVKVPLPLATFQLELVR